jgi:hypothetical protein
MVKRQTRATQTWTTSIVVVGLESEPGWSLYCEPEGKVQRVDPGDQLTITFTAAKAHALEVSKTGDGVILCRTGDSVVTIEDRRGRDLSW